SEVAVEYGEPEEQRCLDRDHCLLLERLRLAGAAGQRVSSTKSRARQSAQATALAVFAHRNVVTSAISEDFVVRQLGHEIRLADPLQATGAARGSRQPELGEIARDDSQCRLSDVGQEWIDK